MKLVDGVPYGLLWEFTFREQACGCCERRLKDTDEVMVMSGWATGLDDYFHANCKRDCGV